MTSRRPHVAGRRRTALVLLLASVGLGLSPGSARAATPGCDQLTVQAATRTPDGVRLDVTVPSDLGKVVVPPAAFTFVEEGRQLPVRAERASSADRAVAVVVARAADTTADSWAQTLSAARELLSAAPAQASTMLVAAGDTPRVVVPLGQGRAPAITGLTTLSIPAAADVPGALELARAALPAGGRADVVLFTAGRAPAEVPPPVGVTLHQLSFDGGGAGGGCPTPGSGVGLIPGADAVAEQLTSAYRLVVPGAAAAGGRLQVDYLGTASGADVPSSAGDPVLVGDDGQGTGGLSLSRVLLSLLLVGALLPLLLRGVRERLL